jgi:hypothetical protein
MARGKTVFAFLFLGYITNYALDLQFLESTRKIQRDIEISEEVKRKIETIKSNRLSLSVFLSLVYYEWIYKVCTDIYLTDKRKYCEKIKELKNLF